MDLGKFVLQEEKFEVQEESFMIFNLDKFNWTRKSLYSHHVEILILFLICHLRKTDFYFGLPMPKFRFMILKPILRSMKCRLQTKSNKFI